MYYEEYRTKGLLLWTLHIGLHLIKSTKTSNYILCVILEIICRSIRSQKTIISEKYVRSVEANDEPNIGHKSVIDCDAYVAPIRVRNAFDLLVALYCKDIDHLIHLRVIQLF